MYMLLNYWLILNIFQFVYSCKPYYKYVDRDIDEASLTKYPWLVVVRNVRDDFFKLCYGSLIHRQAILTSSIGVIGRRNDDLLVETDCKDIGFVKASNNCMTRNVARIIHQSDLDYLRDFDNSYVILILQTSFDLTDRIQPISLAGNTNAFIESKCLYMRWMREYNQLTDRKGIVTVAYKTTFNGRKLDEKSWDYNQLIFDKDWLISKSYHLPFFNATDKHLLNFIGGPIVCKTKQQSMVKYVQVGIANFRIIVYPKHYIDADIIIKGTQINTIPSFANITRTLYDLFLYDI